MATESLRHRLGDDSTITNPNENNHDIYKEYDDDNDNEDEYEDYIEETSMRGRMLRWRAAIVRHGFLSLAIAILPASLHLVDVFVLRSAERAAARPSWFLTPWITDAYFVFSSLVMGLGSWFAWAENGLPPKPMLFASKLLVYNALSLAWDPIVFGWGAVHLGPQICMLRGFLVVAIAGTIRRQNHTAGEFVFGACGVIGGIHLFHSSLDLLLPEHF
ncbi:uncharacterized protein LOC131299529 [Rhododendron vialii]|uniref:uncharacterized protein LOC131299529 n=1 Tax=Rhododendron vialii TaxID=182163 RepID=UPI00265D9ACC|nr:uncharacterized protein LOC131299529 [Rhododendron vialii]